MVHTGDMYHLESVSQGLLLWVVDPAIGDLLEGPVTKYLEEWLVVYCNDEVIAA